MTIDKLSVGEKMNADFDVSPPILVGAVNRILKTVKNIILICPKFKVGNFFASCTHQQLQNKN